MNRTRLHHVKRRRAAARIRQLASLDATGPHLAPMLLREVRELLAFDSGGYMYPEPDGTITAYMETADAQRVMPLYFDPRMQQQVRQLTRGYHEAALHEYGPLVTPQLTKVPWPEFERSDFFNLVLRPAGMLDCVSLMPRLSGGQAVGALKMYRCTRTQPFRTEELAELAQLEPFFAQALAPREPGDCDSAHSMGTEMLVASLRGRLLWMSARAEEWMFMAFGHRWLRRKELPEAMQVVLQRLSWMQQGRPVDQPSEIEVRSAYGRFTLRASILAASQAGHDVAGVQITWQVDRSVRLLEAIGALRLPARQAEMGFLLASGLPEQDIARLTEVSLHTVVYHRRQLYARLQVSSRRELVARLLA